MSMHPSILTSITVTTLPQYITSEKTSDKPSIHPLQSPTGLPCFVPYIQASDLPTHVPSVYSIIITSDGPSNLPILHTILNPSLSLSQPHLIPPVTISVPFYWNVHHCTLLLILNQQTVVFQPMMLVM